MLNSKLSSFSDDGTLLGICSSGEVLKLWNTSSGIFEHEFHPGEYLSSSITCLKFSPKINKEVFKVKKKHERQILSDPSEVVIALGTKEGTILIYSLAKQKVLKILEHSSNSSVRDLFWQSENRLISLGKNKKLAIWDTINFQQLYVLKVSGNQCCCALKENQFVIASTSIHLYNFNPENKEITENSISGHKNNITQIFPIFLNKENESKYFITVAENDRYFYVWSSNPEFSEHVGIFIAKDFVATIHCIDMGNSSIGIVVTTGKGHLKLFLHHLNGSSSSKPTKSNGSLEIKSNKNNILTILNAKFISTKKIIFTYGTELFPHCEVIAVSSLDRNLSWNRKDPSTFSTNKESALVKNVTPNISNDTVHLIPTQIHPLEKKEAYTKRKRGGETANLPMEERLDALSLTQPISAAASGRPLNNYVHLLVQALHSKDSTLMNNILSKGEDEDVINNTVRRLPVSNIVPFLLYLQEIIMGKGLKNLTCIQWIKSVLYHHMSYLSSIPEKEELLEPFYSVFAAKAASLIAVTKLQSRISLLLTHVKNRHESVKLKSSDSHLEALIKYKEDSSDDEDRIGLELEGAPSESEDIWDDWTESEDEEVDDEDEEEEEEEEETSNGQTSKHRNRSNTEKRKLSDNDDDEDEVLLTDDSNDEELIDYD